MSIRWKLNIFFMSAALIVLSSGVFTLIALNSSAEAQQQLEQSRGHQQIALRLEAAMHEAIADLRVYLSKPAKETPVSSGTTQELIELASKLESAATSPNSVELTASLAQTVRAYLKSAQRAEFLVSKKQDTKALNYIRPWIENQLTPELRLEVSAFVDYQQGHVDRALNTAKTARVFANRSTQISMIVLSCMAIAVFFLLRQWFVSAVELLLRAVSGVSKGVYLESALDSRKDEFGVLAKEVKQLSAKLSQTREELAEKERLAAMGEMTYAVAHNLRNPLASMRALAQGSRFETSEMPELDSSLKSIMDAVDRADHWLKQLFASSRPVRIASEEHDLGEFLQELIQNLASFAAQKNVRLSLSLPTESIHAEIDRARLQQALICFVSNAIEASSENQIVQIGCTSDLSEVELEITDNGPGLDAAARSKMFLPYESSKPGGMGLGLNLAQRIIYGHGGRLHVDTAPGEGCSIKITLPKSGAQDKPQHLGQRFSQEAKSGNTPLGG